MMFVFQFYPGCNVKELIINFALGADRNERVNKELYTWDCADTFTSGLRRYIPTSQTFITPKDYIGRIIKLKGENKSSCSLMCRRR